MHRPPCYLFLYPPPKGESTVCVSRCFLLNSRPPVPVSNADSALASVALISCRWAGGRVRCIRSDPPSLLFGFLVMLRSLAWLNKQLIQHPKLSAVPISPLKSRFGIARVGPQLGPQEQQLVRHPDQPTETGPEVGSDARCFFCLWRACHLSFKKQICN